MPQNIREPIAPKKFLIATLGCKVNQYESEQLRQILTAAGYVAEAEGPVDCILINTCAVTLESEAKSRKLVRQLLKRHEPRRVVVFGCSAERDTTLFSDIPGVTDVVISSEFGGNRVAAVLHTLGLEAAPESLETFRNGLCQFGERHRAYLKVQDGCRQFCTYCLISHLRHELSSVPPEEVVAEARTLLENGYRELIVTGIHLGYYGINLRSREQLVWRAEDRNENRTTNLTDLMARLATLDSPRDYRLRISSLEAHEASDDLLELMAERKDRICPHLHLSMQSGSGTVMARMHRPGTIAQYVARCESAKRILGQVALTTDIIVGFPGETESEFLETCDVARQLEFSKIHIFPFSARPGTPAFSMENPVPAEEKQRRCAYLAQIESETHLAFERRVADVPSRLLVERFHPESGTVSGTSQFYLHQTYPGTPEMVGEFVEF